MDTILARKMWATLEPFHAMIYFAPEGFEAWERLGFPHRGMGYFASRAAPMGAVTAPVVAATFYNFNPDLVARFIPAAWEIAPPAEILAARYDAVDRALRRMLDPDSLESDEMASAAATAGEATEACPADGRALFGSHRRLDWPEEPHLRLWHALTLFREFRGDGHVASLLDADVSGIEAVVSYAATGEAFDAHFYRRSRGWSEEAWAAAEQRLTERGWLLAGELTDEGRAGREAIESATDRLAMAPWQAIGQERSDQLRATVRPWSRAIVAAGGLGG